MAFAIATFNVRDFFDDTSPHVIGDLDRRGPLDAATALLATELYRAKIATLAAAVRRLDADVIGFQEIKNTRVLDDLRAALPRWRGQTGYGYGPAVAGEPDARGIACGLLSRFPVVATQSHLRHALAFPGFAVGDPAPFGEHLRTHRAVLEAEIALPDGDALRVLVLHFKSPLPTPLIGPDGQEQGFADQRALAEGAVRSLVSRLAEALFVRGLIDQCFDVDSASQLVVLGDFNDGPDSVVVQTVAGDRVAAAPFLPAAARGVAGRALYACARAVPAACRYSLLYRGERQQPDHLLVSAPLWARFQGARFDNECLGEQSAADAARGALSLQSDHAPLRAEFV